MAKLSLKWKIAIGMLLGVAVGFLCQNSEIASGIVSTWIKPIGDLFINLLKLIAVPLVVISLAKGISDLRDLSTLSKIGGRTIILFLITTLVAVILGLVLVNVFQPGAGVDSSVLQEMSSEYSSIASSKIELKENVERGPLDFFVNLVPDNFVAAASSNSNMLQVIFFTVFFSICLLLLPLERQRPLLELFDVSNDVILKMVELIMKFAPYAVFALMATLMVETADGDLFVALLSCAGLMVLGLIIILVIYLLGIAIFTDMPVMTYAKGVLPAQLVALTTSSSMATLPITMERVEELGVNKEVSSFVCPVGATLNMDATSLMQALAAVFVCQVVGHELEFSDQLTILLTGALASIGAAGAPSAGIVRLIMVLESVNFPSEHLPFALAIILAVDRPLDMGRTVVNVSGDTFVAVLVAKSLNKFKN